MVALHLFGKFFSIFFTEHMNRSLLIKKAIFGARFQLSSSPKKTLGHYQSYKTALLHAVREYGESSDMFFAMIHLKAIFPKS